jgi:DNA-binding MarR family transcriptional regulator
VIQNHSAVGLVSRLVDKGLVVRDTSTQDRRRVILWLTPLAEQKLETIARNNLRELNRAADIMEDLLQKLRRMDADGVWSEEGPQDPVAEA